MRFLFLSQFHSKAFVARCFFASFFLSLPAHPRTVRTLIPSRVALSRRHLRSRPSVPVQMLIGHHCCSSFQAGSLIGDARLSPLICGALIATFFLVSGFLVKISHIPWAFSWLTYISPFTWSFAGLVINQFEGKYAGFQPAWSLDRPQTELGHVKELMFSSKSIGSASRKA